MITSAHGEARRHSIGRHLRKESHPSENENLQAVASSDSRPEANQHSVERRASPLMMLAMPCLHT